MQTSTGWWNPSVHGKFNLGYFGWKRGMSSSVSLTWKTIRDFSSRYWEVMAPLITPLDGETERNGTEQKRKKKHKYKRSERRQHDTRTCLFDCILTLPERPLCISQSDWNYRSVQFWHFQRIPGEELPRVSARHSNTVNQHPLSARWQICSKCLDLTVLAGL